MTTPPTVWTRQEADHFRIRLDPKRLARLPENCDLLAGRHVARLVQNVERELLARRSEVLGPWSFHSAARLLHSCGNSVRGPICRARARPPERASSPPLCGAGYRRLDVVLPLAQLGRYRQETHAIRRGSTTRHREKYKEHYDISGERGSRLRCPAPHIASERPRSLRSWGVNGNASPKARWLVVMCGHRP